MIIKFGYAVFYFSVDHEIFSMTWMIIGGSWEVNIAKKSEDTHLFDYFQTITAGKSPPNRYNSIRLLEVVLKKSKT
jgi:hypothetical protein